MQWKEIIIDIASSIYILNMNPKQKQREIFASKHLFHLTKKGKDKEGVVVVYIVLNEYVV